MATEEFYEVERVVDRRRSKKGKVEYLVRWRGYSPEGDTWEPETHLSTCMTHVHDFNRQLAARQRANTLLRSTRCGANHRTHSRPSHADDITQSRQTHSDDIRGSAPEVCEQVFSSLGPAHLSALTCPSPRFSNMMTTGVTSLARRSVDQSQAGMKRSVDLSKSGIKILVPKSPMDRRPHADAQGHEAGAGENHLVPPEVALLEKPSSVQLGPGEERARMGTRPRGQTTPTHTRIPLGNLPEAPPANGMQSSVAMGTSGGGGGGGHGGVAMGTGVGGKRRLEERCAFDKRLRFSVRQTESAYRYRDLVVKKQDGFTHILLSTKTSENNTLNPEVMKEVQSAMATAASDDSKLVLLGSVGGLFCGGLDFLYFIRRLTEDRKKESIKMAETIRTFINTFIQFRKPIVAAVNGPAVGLGAAILPLCDVVWANEKAWFQTPYTAYGQTPDGCASFTFPKIMGLAAANELLLSGRKLTAQEACAKGLVSQVIWPGTFNQEVMLRIKELVAVDSMVLRESKQLMRSSSRSPLEQTNERECEALKRVWGSAQGTDAILRQLQGGMDL